jgi:hypothetical protein
MIQGVDLNTAEKKIVPFFSLKFTKKVAILSGTIPTSN